LTANGVVVCSASAAQSNQQLILDGSGGIIVAWEDGRLGFPDIYAQRLNSSGAPQWTANGVPVCNISNQQNAPVLLSDGSGGAIIVWQDLRSGSHFDIYAQRVNSSGATQWTAGGNALCTQPSHQQEPVVISDGAGGAIVTWYDSRTGSGADIYAQRFDAAGNALWSTDW
jgi:hypothetical protein